MWYWRHHLGDHPWHNRIQVVSFQPLAVNNSDLFLMRGKVFSAEFHQFISIQLGRRGSGSGLFCAKLRSYWSRLIFQVSIATHSDTQMETFVETIDR